MFNIKFFFNDNKLILVIGNHLNKDSSRLGGANAFHLHSVLPQLDSNLMQMLVCLAETVKVRPTHLRDELNLVEKAAKSNFIQISYSNHSCQLYVYLCK